MADATDPLTIQGPGGAPAGMQLSPADLDAVTRTVATEAGNPDAWGAVANSIRNRATQGGYGDTPTDIVRAKGQYEVWANGRAQALDPSSPQYQQAARVVNAVFAGQAPDNTSGATHFYSPAGQAVLGADGRQQVPAWAPPGSQTASVGGNVFFAPKGRVTHQAAAVPSPAAPVQVASAAPAPAPASAFDALEVEHPADVAGAPTAQPQPAAAPAAASASPFDALAVEHPDETPASAPAPAGRDHGMIAAGAAGILNGVPILGPTLLSGAENAAARIRAMRYGISTDDALKEVQGDIGATNAAHPIANTVGGVGGAAIGFAPLAAAAPGALGLAGGNMLTRVGLGALSNGAIGAADSAARGENALTGGGIAALVGGAAPPVAKLAGNALGGIFGGGTGLIQAGLNKLGPSGSSSGLSGVSMPAARYMLEGLNADGVPAARNALTDLGDHGMILDTGPGSRGNAAGMLGPATPEATIISKALTDRDAGAKGRIRTALQGAIGPDVDAQHVRDTIEAMRDANTSPLYAQIRASAQPVDTSGVVDAIDGMLHTPDGHPLAVGKEATALQTLRDRLVLNPGGVDAATGAEIPPTYASNPGYLLNVRQEADKVLQRGEAGLGVGPAAVERMNASLGNARAALDSALKVQVSGLPEADAAFSHLADVQNGVARGMDKTLGAAGPHPDSFATARAGLNPQVAQAENAGIASQVYKKFGSGTRSDRVKLNSLLSGEEDGYDTRRLQTAFGEAPINELLGTSSAETTFANSSNELIGKSNTNRLAAGMKRGQETDPGSMNFSASNPTGLAIQGAKKLIGDPLVRIITANPNASRNIEIAKMLTAKGADAQHVLDGLAALDSQFKGASALRDGISSGTNALLGYGAPALADTAGGGGPSNALTIQGQRR